jgi:hypothetical protein
MRARPRQRRSSRPGVKRRPRDGSEHLRCEFGTGLTLPPAHRLLGRRGLGQERPEGIYSLASKLRSLFEPSGYPAIDLLIDLVLIRGHLPTPGASPRRSTTGLTSSLAPMACGVPDRDEDRDVTPAGLREGVGRPWPPVDRVLGVLLEIGRLGVGQPVHEFILARRENGGDMSTENAREAAPDDVGPNDLELRSTPAGLPSPAALERQYPGRDVRGGRPARAWRTAPPQRHKRPGPSIDCRA